MPRPKKDAKILNIRVDSKVYDQLEQYCKDTGQPKTTAVERILSRHFESFYKNPEIEKIQ